MSLASQLSDGQGGLQFTAQAPPGIGRLIRIPFYLTTATNGFDPQVPGTVATAGGVYTSNGGTVSTVSPVILATNAAANIGPTANLVTPQISWATLRIVGFEVSVSKAACPNTNRIIGLCFQDLQIGGGANLFIHEDWADSALYASANDNFAGLRDYPLLRSPNTARVSCAIAGTGLSLAAGSNLTSVIGHMLFSANLVCEILQDDNYGSHVPGPYARKGAMVRRGGSFIS